MEKLNKVVAILKKENISIALAESCSSGYASYLLTKSPGASSFFKGAVIIYSLDSKNTFFKINPTLLKKTQGVSKEISLTLAKGVRKKFNATVGASIVGFAGPTAKKKSSLGTIFISVVKDKKMLCKKLTLKGSRDAIRKKASAQLINLIYKCLQKP